MTRSAAQTKAVGFLDDGMFETELTRLVAFPSESQTHDGLTHCYDYLTRGLVPVFEQMGFDCTLFDNPAKGYRPILLATYLEDPALPTVLGYGHGDVVHGMKGDWTKSDDPWKVTRVGDRLYGRGTADNKSQHLINLLAMQAVMATRKHLGFNAKFLIETGEEVGSTGLRQVISDNRTAFAADVFIASDGPRVHPDRATVSLGNRGTINFDLVCDARTGAHHSGNWGGALADPAAVLAHVIASIVSHTGQILIPEWRPAPIRPLVRDLLADVVLDGGPDGPAVDPEWGEPGLSPAENVYAWNSFAVLAMKAGNPENPVNAIASRATAHCQLRFIAGTIEDDILPALRQHLDALGFAGKITIIPPPQDSGGGFGASRTEPDHPWAAWVCASLQNSTGKTPAILPQMGGSICNDLFTDLLGLPAIWVPHSYAGCNQHAPDEHVLLPTCRSALSVMAGLYWDMGEPGTPNG